MEILNFKSEKTGQVENIEHDGEPHLKVPAVLLTETILEYPGKENSKQFVPEDELEKSTFSWNGTVVALNHPSVRGENVSANNPEVYEDFGIGHVFNARVKNEKLKADLFLNKEDMKQTEEGQELLEHIENGEMVEVSTAYRDKELVESGKHNGEEFEAIQTNITPDHLAVLPVGNKGRCSIEDGCGAPRINQEGEVIQANDESEDNLINKAIDYLKKAINSENEEEQDEKNVENESTETLDEEQDSRDNKTEDNEMDQNEQKGESEMNENEDQEKSCECEAVLENFDIQNADQLEQALEAAEETFNAVEDEKEELVDEICNTADFEREWLMNQGLDHLEQIKDNIVDSANRSLKGNAESRLENEEEEEDDEENYNDERFSENKVIDVPNFTEDNE